MQGLKWFKVLIIVLLLLGIFWRFFHLDYKVYWFDEVYTSLRAAGFTTQEIDTTIWQDKLFTTVDLQQFQHLKPESTYQDTLNSLVTEDPQHPPLYFFLARFWMQQFGSSITASRTLPVLISLLSLPAMYALAQELFANSLVAWLATAFLALSPFDILFAQTARQYSLLTLAIIVSSWLLLRALKLQKWHRWFLYIIASTLGLYAHPFFALILMAQFLLVALQKLRHKSLSVLFPLISYLLIPILYSPWLWIMYRNYQTAASNTSGTSRKVSLVYMLKQWTLSFTTPFFDLDFGSGSIGTYLLRLPILLLIVVAVYRACRHNESKTYSFILLSILLPFLCLALPDLIVGGKRSTVTRYLLPCFPGIQLAVAYWFAYQIAQGKKFWQGMLAVLLTGSIISSGISAFSDSWWSKGISYPNPEIARQINQASNPILISDRGANRLNRANLISISYLLRSDVKLLLLSHPPSLLGQEQIASQKTLGKEVFVYIPSLQLREVLEQKYGELEIVDSKGKLWRLV